ncbi:MAG: hypothetical protein E7425_11795 [Ruminococcaceae bacterium]|jgi:hypothetical protein|nr:hypothetical protein [Oscillospiraceae bacterium]
MTLLRACVLTVLFETPLFFAAGYRDRDSLTVVICANVVSNLTLNLCVAFLFPERGAVEYVLEALVVAMEYAVYALAFGRSRRLFLLTLAANCLSYGLGLLLFG